MAGLRVISGGGGNGKASLTERSGALALAFERLNRGGILKNSPLIDSVEATSVGIVTTARAVSRL